MPITPKTPLASFYPPTLFSALSNPLDFQIFNLGVGTEGDDIINADGTTNPVMAGGGNDRVYGSNSADVIYGEAGNDVLYGNGGDDHLFGGFGNDQLNGGIGADLMVGGDGNDTYDVDNALDVVIELAGEGNDTVYARLNYVLPEHIETLELLGTGHIDGFGNDQDNKIYGNTGNNILNGGKGNDYLKGGAGTDLLVGGEGNDKFDVDNIGDVVIELSGGGSDIVYSSVTFTLGDNIENLELIGFGNIDGIGNNLDNKIYGNASNTFGGSGNNNLYGLGGNDYIKGGAGYGMDFMYGGEGDDTYEVDYFFDFVFEEFDEGIDTVYSYANFTLGPNVENLELFGGGSLGIGNELNNKIYGTGWSDYIHAKAGNDILAGRGGQDNFVFEAATQNGKDQINDFLSGDDKLLFDGQEYGFAAEHALTAQQLTFGAAAVGTSAQFVFNAANHTLYWDADGAGGQAAIALATIYGSATITAGDFLFY